MGGVCCLNTRTEGDVSKVSTPDPGKFDMHQLISNEKFVRTFLEGRWTAEIQLAVNELRAAQLSPRKSELSDYASKADSY